MDLPNRDTEEKTLAALLLAIFDDWRLALFRTFDVNWEAFRSRLLLALRKRLEELALFAYLLWLGNADENAGFRPPANPSQARKVADGLFAARDAIAAGTATAADVPVNGNLFAALVAAASRAANYAINRATEIADSVVQTIRDRYIPLSDAIRSGAATEAELASLENLVSPNRANTIAVTETTGAFENGKLEAVDEFERKIGQPIKRIWRTQLDPKVCPVCQPLNETERSFWGLVFPKGPPAHPWCRCFIQLKL